MITVAQQAKNSAFLAKSIVYDGRMMTRADFVRLKIQDGYTPKIELTSAIKEASRTRLNRMDQNEQNIYHKKRLKVKYEYNLANDQGGSIEVNKSEFNFALELLDHPEVKAPKIVAIDGTCYIVNEFLEIIYNVNNYRFIVNHLTFAERVEKSERIKMLEEKTFYILKPIIENRTTLLKNCLTEEVCDQVNELWKQI